MKTTLATLAAFCLTLTGPAFANCIDPDPDGVGIYFDEGATECMIMEPTPGETYTAHVILTNMTGAQVVAWGAKVTVSDDRQRGPAAITEWRFPTPSRNAFTEPDFAVLPDVPLPYDAAVVLASFDYLYEGGVVYFHLGPPLAEKAMLYNQGAATIDRESCCSDQGDPYNCYLVMWPSSGSFDLPVACIGCFDVVDTESTSWGSVRTLFR